MKIPRKIPARFLITACIAAVAAGMVAWLVVLQPLPGIPSFEKVRSSYLQSEGILLDRNGDIIHELRIHRNGRRLEWASLRDISPALQAAVVRAEDRRFYRHGGMDWISVGGSFVNVVRATRSRGASTITMQLAALNDEDLRPDESRRSWPEKLRQMRAARAYEKSWTKEQILEAYLNLVGFRGELQGIAAASRGLFSKEPQGINDIESVILGSLLRSPNASGEKVADRAYALAQSLSLPVERSEIAAAASETLAKPYFIRPQVALAPHVALRLLDEAKARGRSPGSFSCSLDRALQAFTTETLRRHVLSARTRNMHDGSALVVDNSSGEVLAYVGNIGESSSARYVDGIRAMRQAGSTLKPFVYAMAFDRRLLTPASLIEDSPVDIPAPGGVYRPRNYDNQFRGTVTTRIALASSLNVPAVKTLNLVGVDTFVESLRQAGFENLRSPEFYGSSLALGSADITLWDLVNAYRTLANAGIRDALTLTTGKKASPRKRVLSAGTAFLIADILSDRESRSLTFDLESPLSTRFWTAVKTGTSKDMRDNWCVGFSDRYTVGVWAGNFSGEPMWNVNGITGAAPVWIDIMNQLHSREPSRRPQPPPDLVQLAVDIPSISQSRKEWFFKGTETNLIRHAANRIVPRIAYPTNGTVVALDPDIPPEDQKLFFEADSGGSTLEWFLDGQSMGTTAALIPWSPRKGKHVLQMLDPSGKELDSVEFEVRGNEVLNRIQ